MILKKLPIFLFSIVIGIFFHVIPFEWPLRIVVASDLLPHVSSKMETPEFWIRKIQNSRRLLLTSEEIQKMNNENLNKEELYLCRVRNLKEEWTRSEMVALLKEDWEGFGKTEEVRYGKQGYPLDEAFWSELKRNLNYESLKEKNLLLFGLIVKRTDIRVFPASELSLSSPDHLEFDRFQHSAVSPGSLIGIYHFSRDHLWAYAQTSFIRGWIRITDIGIAKESKEALDYDEAKERLVMTGNFVQVFGDPLLQQTSFFAQMGASFPLLGLPINSKNESGYYIIKTPFREVDGQLTFRKGYIPKNKDVHPGFLPYHSENVAHQAFKMLHQPYGWGEMFGGRDCSRFIMDLFNTFGILMPRNSKLQARVGISLGQVEGKSIKEKQKVLDQAMPMVTLLRLPGHIMLFLGEDKGKYYVIHSLWGIQKGGWGGPKLQKIGKVVVSDLSLGRSGPNQSLLHRLTDIQQVGLGMLNSP